MQNGHTTGTEREVWMERVNFDGHVTGETARALIRQAARVGRNPHDLLQDLIRYGLGELLDGDAKDADVTVEPMTINAGNGGFHVVTFVTDGYGNLIAENSAGMELASAKWAAADAEDATAEDDTTIFADLVKEAFAREQAPITD
ncbi:ribbon-helix-helix DNA binding domain protein [Streptomyces phage Galactica]|nr:ribbon-helix-helix DNA binding domain protein [Streptomyces phage Galactica]